MHVMLENTLKIQVLAGGGKGRILRIQAPLTADWERKKGESHGWDRVGHNNEARERARRAQRIDESRAPSARIPGRGFEVAPTLGPPIKGTAAEDAQSCTSARTIRLLINAVWKIQRDGGATSALA